MQCQLIGTYYLSNLLSLYIQLLRNWLATMWMWSVAARFCVWWAWCQVVIWGGGTFRRWWSSGRSLGQLETCPHKEWRYFSWILERGPLSGEQPQLLSFFLLRSRGAPACLSTGCHGALAEPASCCLGYQPSEQWVKLTFLYEIHLSQAFHMTTNSWPVYFSILFWAWLVGISIYWPAW